MLDFSTHDGMEKTYHQISPTIALGKGFSIGSGISTWEWLLAYHITDSDQILDDFLDRFETAFFWSFVIPVNRLEICHTCDSLTPTIATKVVMISSDHWVLISITFYRMVFHWFIF